MAEIEFDWEEWILEKGNVRVFVRKRERNDVRQSRIIVSEKRE